MREVIDVRGGALALCGSIVLLALAAPAQAATGGAQPNSTAFGSLPTGGAAVDGAQLAATPAPTAEKTGRAAVAPDGVPEAVRAAIASANEIVGRPYRWGGGH